MLTFLQLKSRNQNFFSQITPIFSFEVSVENENWLFYDELPENHFRPQAGPIRRTINIIASGENDIFSNFIDSLGDQFTQKIDIYCGYSFGDIPVNAHCYRDYFISSFQCIDGDLGLLELEMSFVGMTEAVPATFGTVVQENTRPILYNGNHRRYQSITSVNWQAEGF